MFLNCRKWSCRSLFTCTSEVKKLSESLAALWPCSQLPTSTGIKVSPNNTQLKIYFQVWGRGALLILRRVEELWCFCVKSHLSLSPSPVYFHFNTINGAQQLGQRGSDYICDPLTPDDTWRFVALNAVKFIQPVFFFFYCSSLLLFVRCHH